MGHDLAGGDVAPKLKAAPFDYPLGAAGHEVHLLGGRALGGKGLAEAHEGHAAVGIALAVDVLGQRLQGGDLRGVEQAEASESRPQARRQPFIRQAFRELHIPRKRLQRLKREIHTALKTSGLDEYLRED